MTYADEWIVEHLRCGGATLSRRFSRKFSVKYWRGINCLSGIGTRISRVTTLKARTRLEQNTTSWHRLHRHALTINLQEQMVEIASKSARTGITAGLCFHLSVKCRRQPHHVTDLPVKIGGRRSSGRLGEGRKQRFIARKQTRARQVWV